MPGSANRRIEPSVTDAPPERLSAVKAVVSPPQLQSAPRASDTKRAACRHACNCRTLVGTVALNLDLAVLSAVLATSGLAFCFARRLQADR